MQLNTIYHPGSLGKGFPPRLENISNHFRNFRNNKPLGEPAVTENVAYQRGTDIHMFRPAEKEYGLHAWGKALVHVRHGRFIGQFRGISDASNQHGTSIGCCILCYQPFPGLHFYALTETVHCGKHGKTFFNGKHGTFFRVCGYEHMKTVENIERRLDDIKMPDGWRIEAASKYATCHSHTVPRHAKAVNGQSHLACQGRPGYNRSRMNHSSEGFSFSRSLALAGASALLSALAQPNEIFLYGNWVAGLFCLVPLYLALSNALSFARLAAVGALFGAMHHALTSYWLFFYRDFAFWTLGTTTIAYAVIYGVAALYASFLIQHSRRAAPIVFALGWAFFEYSKSIGFLGYPWGLVPYSFTAVPAMLQTADIWGVYGISSAMAFWAALIGEWLVHLPSRRSGDTRKSQALKRYTAGALAIAIFLVVYGEVSLKRTWPHQASLRLLLCQQNTDPWIEGEQAALASNLKLARQALEKNRKEGGRNPDLIVFSETSLRRPFAEYRSWFEKNPPAEPLIPFLKKEGIPLLTGLPVIIDWEKYTASNSAGLISPEGKLLKTYAKMHPVPFAEAIPFWEYAWFRSFMQNVIGLESGWVMGAERVLFEIRAQAEGTDGNAAAQVRFAAPICFEDAFADICRAFVLDGADLLINLTNDSWSRTESAQIQHYAVARFRAIELRRTLVRSTNSGVTCVIGADGRSILELPQFSASSVVVDVPVIRAPLTLYARHGDWWAHLCAGYTILLFAWSIIDVMFGSRRYYI